MALKAWVTIVAPASNAARAVAASAPVCPIAAAAPVATIWRIASIAPGWRERHLAHRPRTRAEQPLDVGGVRRPQIRGVVRAAAVVVERKGPSRCEPSMPG